MKTKLLTTIICACSLFTVQAQEWGYVSSLQDEWLRKIWTQGLDTVYIVGENGLIARSIDQGEKWDKKYFPTKVALNDIIFIDHDTGFAVGEQGTILKTVDAGEHWSQIPVTTTSHINAVAATGLDNIWAVGDNSLILHSTDAGETWEQKNILPENDRQLTDIAFRGNLGYFTGNYATVYKTEYWGVIWNKQIIDEGANLSTIIYNSINIMENKTYLASSIFNLSSNNSLYSTEDQGNWMFVSDLGFGCYYPFFLNDNVGYVTFVQIAVGSSMDNIIILKTINGGKNWTMEEIRIYPYFPSSQGIGYRPSKIKMINETLGYAIFSQVLFKIPAPSPVGINKIRGNAQLHISQTTDNELVLNSESNPIQAIEIFDTLGKKLINKQWQNQVRGATININNLHKGVYMIKVTHSDNTISINKFLIR